MSRQYKPGVLDGRGQGRCRLGNPFERLRNAELALSRQYAMHIRGSKRRGTERGTCIVWPARTGLDEQCERPDLLNGRVGARHGVVVRLDRL